MKGEREENEEKEKSQYLPVHVFVQASLPSVFDTDGKLLIDTPEPLTKGPWPANGVMVPLV